MYSQFGSSRQTVMMAKAYRSEQLRGPAETRIAAWFRARWYRGRLDRAPSRVREQRTLDGGDFSLGLGNLNAWHRARPASWGGTGR